MGLSNPTTTTTDALALTSAVGPASGNIIFYGDSLIQGVGSSTTGLAGSVSIASPYTGTTYSIPDVFQTTAIGLGLRVFNLGISGQTTAQGNSQYGPGVVSTTGTLTNNSTSGTITGTTTGLSGTMSVWAVNGAISYNTTATISGTTITLSSGATITGSTTLVFGTSRTYGSPNTFTGNAHVLSQASTGINTWFLNEYGTNDYHVGGITAIGTTTSGSTALGSLTIQTGVSVGSASLVGITGYNVWGGTGNGYGSQFTYLGTVASSTSNSVTLSSGANVLSSMVTFKFVPSLSAWETNYQGIVNAALADGDLVMVSTLIPFIAALPAAYTQGQYDESRLLYNAWLQSTYSGNAVSGVSFVDSASIPEFQYSNPNYLSYRSTSAGPHLNNIGYAVWVKNICIAFENAYSTYLQGTQPLMMRGGQISKMLGANVPLTDNSSNTFTGAMTVNGGANGGFIAGGNTSQNCLYRNNGSSTSTPAYFQICQQGTGDRVQTVGGFNGTVGTLPTTYNGWTVNWHNGGGAGVSSNTMELGVFGSSKLMTIDGLGNVIVPGVFFPVQAATAGAPSYVKGGMYFDTTLNKLRIGGATAWETVTSV